MRPSLKHRAVSAAASVVTVGAGTLLLASPALAAPTAATSPATTVHHTSAVLNGHLDPTGDPGITECHFDWGTDTSYTGGSVPCSQGNTFNAPADVSATLGFLSDGIAYHYRLTVTTTSSGILHGGDQSFITPGSPTLHTQLGSFGPDGTAGTAFDGNRFGPLAFRQPTRGLYALNGNAGVPGGIYGFNASGPLSYPPLGAPFPLATSPVGNSEALAVDSSAGPSAGNLYYTVENGSTLAVAGLDSSGAPLAGFPIDPHVNPGGDTGASRVISALAVDPSGHLWLAFGADTDRLLEYSPAGAFLGAVDVSAQIPFDQARNSGGVGAIAFDSNGDLYAGSVISSLSPGPGQGVWRYSAASGYTQATKVDDFGTLAIAVDPANHHLFLAPRSEIKDAEGTQSYEVREYDPAGNLLSEFARGLPSSGSEFAGLAVDGANHYVYVSSPTLVNGHWSSKVYVFDPGTTQELPTVTAEPADSVLGSSATLHAEVDPETHSVTNCHFEYVSDAQYQLDKFASAQVVPCDSDPGAGSGDVKVAAELTNLDAGTTYHTRIVASNATGASKGPDQTLTTLGPRLVSPAASQITDTSATLSAQVNPAGKATTYHFDYVDDATYQADLSNLGAGHGFEHATQAPIPEAAAGSGSASIDVSTPLKGLAPAATYHFRLLATNPDATSHTLDATFTTYSSPPSFDACSNDILRTDPGSGGSGANLLDCRAYEQATPADKDGSDATGSLQTVAAGSGGDAVSYDLIGSAPGLDSSPALPVLIARRGAQNWDSHGVFPPVSFGERSFLDDWTPDLAHAFTDTSAALTPNFFSYLDKDTATDTDTVVHPAPTGNGQSHLIGASADGSLVYFTDPNNQVTSDAAGPGKYNAYVWDRASGTVSLAGLIPAGADTSCGGGAPDCAVPAAGSAAGISVNGVIAGLTQPEHAVSTGGDQLIFSASNTGSPTDGRLYARQGAAGPDPTTTEISAPQPGVIDPNGSKPATFQYATPSGSQVFFTSAGKLTPDATTGPADAGADLYAWDSSTHELTDLTPDATEANGADVQGMVGASDDGSYVYFVANGVLASNTGAQGSTAAAGDCHLAQADPLSFTGHCNLYLHHVGEAQPTFIARLAANQNPTSLGDDAGNWLLTATPDCACSAPLKTGHVSADGHTLLFSSVQRLTAYDNSGACITGYNPAGGGGYTTTAPCPELYRYNTATGLDCVSCNPTDAAPRGVPAALQISTPASGPKVQVQPYVDNLSADGTRAFFQSADKLVAADTNGDKGCPADSQSVLSCTDVYEWEASGAGSCKAASSPYSAKNGGCLYLISTGIGADASLYAGNSASGDDVFFFTRDALVPQDGDRLVDVYDARADGGLSAQHAVGPPPCGSPEQCRGAITSLPNVPGAGTAPFQGPGNPPIERCAVGKVRRGGRCVPRRPHKHHKAKKKHHKAKLHAKRRAHR